VSVLSTLKSLARPANMERKVKPLVAHETLGRAAPPARREIRAASPGEYPGIDTERATALSARLASADSDSEAIAMLRGVPVQVVHQQK
jgi:hypothetical protein